MERNIYGKKMFIADLILVSVWALFFSGYCRPGLMLLIPIRIALCFEMERKSPWTLISAMGFLVAYVCSDCFSKPFESMFYIFFCAIGESELMIDIFSKPLEWEMEAWLGSVATIGFLWLAVMPVVVGLRLHNFKEIQWKRKWMWIYLIPLTALCVGVMFYEGEVGGSILGLVVALLPAVSWCIYNRGGRSPIQLLLNDRKVRWYIIYMTFMLGTVTIGLRDINSLKQIGLLAFPALFYIMLMISLHVGKVLTRCCIALSVAGWLYGLTFDNDKTVSIVMLTVAAALIAYVGVTMIIKNKRWVAALALMIVVPLVIIPFTLGLNPYIILEADSTNRYVSNLSVRRGVYVVERYVESAENGTPNYWGRKHGLRDRYGLILPMEYDGLEVIDGRGRYIVVNKPLRYGCLKSDQRYGVFDLKKRKFIVNPDNLEVMEIEKIDNRTFKLINSEERHFATLYLPGDYLGEYFPDAHVEPHFADGETSVAEFLELTKDVDQDIDDQYWNIMRRENPHAYKLLLEMSALGSVESSPVNDMNYAKAIREIIRKDPYYKGDITKALNDAEKLSETITDSGSQSDINVWTGYLRLISSIRTSLAYDSLMCAIPDNEWIGKEYVAWHNLIEAMAYYLDYLYSAENYLAVPEEKNIKIKEWLDVRGEAVEKECDILVTKQIYCIPAAKSDSIKDESDFREFFSNFHSYCDPYYYNPMWNEIKAAFDEWIDARTKIAEQLEAHQSLSYTEYSKEVINKMFSFIEEMDLAIFRPALD